MKKIRGQNPIVLAIGAIAIVGGIVVMAKGGSGKWYSGGTLHAASIAEWQKGTAKNKLATAADWTTRYIGSENLKTVQDEGLKRMAGDVVTCVDRATETPSELKIDAPDAALGCMILMGYPRKK